MKTQNKKKIIVSTLAIAMGAALAGSISGSVAWYQYSTRAAAQIQGTAAGTIGELQIQGRKSGAASYIDGGSSNSIVLGRDNFKPMSIYKDGTETKYVDAPVYQTPILPAQKNDALHYIDYELNFKFEHKESASASELLAKKVYLVDFDIANAGTADITGAVRVELCDKDGASLFLLSDNDAGETTVTSGNLDLNGNLVLDTDEWDCKDAGSTKITYKNHATLGASYDTVAHSSVVVDKNADDFDPYDLETGNSAKVLLETKTSGWSDNLIVRVWLEGWALLGGAENANWGTEYLAQNFNINMQFACSAERL